MKRQYWAAGWLLASGSALAGWLPVQTLAPAQTVDKAGMEWQNPDSLTWGRIDNVALTGVDVRLPQVVQMFHSQQGGAWLTQPITELAWVASFTTSENAAFWVQRSNPHDPSGTESVYAAFLSNGAWRAVEVSSWPATSLLPSDILAVEKLANGHFRLTLANQTPEQGALWQVRALLLDDQGQLLDAGDGAGEMLSYPGVKVYHSGSVVFSAKEGDLYWHRVDVNGAGWRQGVAYDRADSIQLLDAQAGYVLAAEAYGARVAICRVATDAALSCTASFSIDAGWQVQAGKVEASSGGAALLSWSEFSPSQGRVRLKTAVLSAADALSVGPELASNQAFKVAAGTDGQFAVSWIDSAQNLYWAGFSQRWTHASVVAQQVKDALPCFAGATPWQSWLSQHGELQVQWGSGRPATVVGQGWTQLLACSGRADGLRRVAGQTADSFVVAAYEADPSLPDQAVPEPLPTVPVVPPVPVEPLPAPAPADDPSRGSGGKRSGGGGGGGSFGASWLALLGVLAFRKSAQVSNQ